MSFQQYLAHEARVNRHKLKHENETDCPRKNPIVECAVGDEPLETNQSQEGTAGRFRVQFVSIRKRLCDPDNLSVKWLLDCLRYCGSIPGDEPEKIILEVSQRHTGKNEQEHTTIEVTEL